MGSGCLQIPVSSNCGTPVSSNCVLYMGDPVPLLGICTGDTITEVETVLINQITNLLSGTGITLNQVTLSNCPYLISLFGAKDKTLTNILQLLVDATCDLKSLIDTINESIQSSNYSFNLNCLPTPSDTSPNGILQQLINSFCTLSATVNSIVSSSGDTTIITSSINSALLNLITSAGGKGIKKTVTNGLSSYYFYGLMMPYMAGFYTGPLSVFDNTGLGLSGTYAEGFAICNGNNGTIDMRGFVGVGAIQGVPGGTLDSLVDPISNSNSTMNYSIGSKGGQAFVSLTGNQNGNHNHVLTDPTHTHNILGIRGGDNNDNNNTTRFAGGDKNQGETSFYFTNTAGIQSASTGITMASSGSGSPHENRMPYKAGVWVMRLNT